MIDADPAPPPAKMRAKLVADLVRGRHAGETVQAIPDEGPAELAPAAEPTPPPSVSRNETALFFAKGIASAKGFRPPFWSYRRKAGGDRSPAVPAETAVEGSPVDNVPPPAGQLIDATKAMPERREGEAAPAGDRIAVPQTSASGPPDVNNVFALVRDARLLDVPASSPRRPIQADPEPAPPESALEMPPASPPASSPAAVPHSPAPLDEIAVARLLAPGKCDPLPDSAVASEARDAEPDASAPSASALAEPREAKGEPRHWPAVLDEMAIAELLSPGNREAPAPAALPERPIAIEARETPPPDALPPDPPTRGPERQERPEARPVPISSHEAAIAQPLPPAVEPDRTAAPSAPIGPAVEHDGFSLNPLSPVLCAIRRGRNASRQIIAGAAEKSPAIAELLSPGNREAPAPAALPERPITIEARETPQPDASPPDLPTRAPERQERAEARPGPISSHEAAIAEHLPPAVEPDRTATPSALIGPAVQHHGFSLNPLSPILGAIRRGRNASREIVAGAAEKSAAFPYEAPGPAESAGAPVASDVAVEATPSLDLRDDHSVAAAEEPAGLSEPPAQEHPADYEYRLESDSDAATLAPPPEGPGETSEADTAKEEMIESLGAAIESVLSERRYGSPQPTRQAGLASYRSVAVEAVTSSSLLDELGAARPVETEEPPPTNKRSGFAMGILGVVSVAILMAYVFSKGDLGVSSLLSSLIRQVTQFVS
jgi:hypothetical protein